MAFIVTINFHIVAKYNPGSPSELKKITLYSNVEFMCFKQILVILNYLHLFKMNNQHFFATWE